MPSKTPLLVIAFLSTFCLEAAAQTNPSENAPPLSAQALSKLAGLEISTRLIVGDLEEIKKGNIPLAATIPTTVAVVEQPQEVPLTFPPAQKKLVFPDEFDADLFVSLKKTMTGYGEEVFYKNLVYTPMGSFRRRYTDSPILRPVWVNEEQLAELGSKRNSPRQKSTNRPPKERVKRDKTVRENHNQRAPKFVGKSKGKRDYF